MRFLKEIAIEAATVCVMCESDNHTYHMIPSDNPDEVKDNYSDSCQTIHFQKGPILENGINGITEASLLQILIDRYEYFQKMEGGKYATKENECVLDNLYCCVCKLNQRTLNRKKRGIEGTSNA